MDDSEFNPPTTTMNGVVGGRYNTGYVSGPVGQTLVPHVSMPHREQSTASQQKPHRFSTMDALPSDSDNIKPALPGFTYPAAPVPPNLLGDDKRGSYRRPGSRRHPNNARRAKGEYQQPKVEDDTEVSDNWPPETAQKANPFRPSEQELRDGVRNNRPRGGPGWGPPYGYSGAPPRATTASYFGSHYPATSSYPYTMGMPSGPFASVGWGSEPPPRPPVTPPRPPPTQLPSENERDPEKEAIKAQLEMITAAQKREELEDKIREETESALRLKMEQMKEVEEARAEERRKMLELSRKEIEEIHNEAKRAAKEAMEAERELEAIRQAAESETRARMEQEIRNKIQLEMKAEEEQKKKQVEDFKRLEVILREKIKAENAEATGGWDMQFATNTQRRIQQGIDEIMLLTKKKLLQEIGARSLEDEEEALPPPATSQSQYKTNFSSYVVPGSDISRTRGRSAHTTMSMSSFFTPPGDEPGTQTPHGPEPSDESLGDDEGDDEGVDEDAEVTSTSTDPDPLDKLHQRLNQHRRQRNRPKHRPKHRRHHYERENQPEASFRQSKEYEAMCMLREALIEPITAVLASHMMENAMPDDVSPLHRRHHQRPSGAGLSKSSGAQGSTGKTSQLRGGDDSEAFSFTSDPEFNWTGSNTNPGVGDDSDQSAVDYSHQEDGDADGEESTTISTLSQRTEPAVDSMLSTTRHDLTSTVMTDPEEVEHAATDMITKWSNRTVTGSATVEKKPRNTKKITRRRRSSVKKIMGVVDNVIDAPLKDEDDAVRKERKGEEGYEDVTREDEEAKINNDSSRRPRGLSLFIIPMLSSSDQHYQHHHEIMPADDHDHDDPSYYQGEESDPQQQLLLPALPTLLPPCEDSNVIPSSPFSSSSFLSSSSKTKKKQTHGAVVVARRQGAVETTEEEEVEVDSDGQEFSDAVEFLDNSGGAGGGE